MGILLRLCAERRRQIKKAIIAEQRLESPPLCTFAMSPAYKNSECPVTCDSPVKGETNKARLAARPDSTERWVLVTSLIKNCKFFFEQRSFLSVSGREGLLLTAAAA